MRIYPLPIKKEFQPDSQRIISSPLQTRNVEQDFFEWLPTSEYIAYEQSEADWDYLPLFWGRYWVNHYFDAVDEMQAETLRLVSRHRRTFTIADFDILSLLPGFDFCGMTVFTTSRREDNGSIDIPLLCLPHQKVYSGEEKKWLASFVGNLSLGPRMEMAEALSSRNDCYVVHASGEVNLFEDTMLSSYIALSPRGHGGSSFRFLEAMQMGVVPLLIGWPDVRPFKKWINWEVCSLYRQSALGLSEFLDGLDKSSLLMMGDEAKKVYDEKLAFGRWCHYVIRELQA